MVGDVLNWLLPKNRDDQEIRNIININRVELDREEERETHRKSFIIYFPIFFLIYLDLHPFRKIRKLATIFKYQPANRSLLQSQIEAHEIEKPHWMNIGRFFLNIFRFLLLNLIDSDIRWNSTYELLKNFLELYPAIKSTIDISKTILPKEEYQFLDDEIRYIRETFEIFRIFTKPSLVL